MTVIINFFIITEYILFDYLSIWILITVQR